MFAARVSYKINPTRKELDILEDNEFYEYETPDLLHYILIDSDKNICKEYLKDLFIELQNNSKDFKNRIESYCIVSLIDGKISIPHFNIEII